MKILFIYNPNSGDESGEEFIGEVQKYLEGFFEEIILKETKKEGDGTRFVQETKDVDAIGVYGGDGTVNEVLLGMNKVSSKAKLLVLPGGTGNLFAKKLGIDDDKEAALRSFDFTKSKRLTLEKLMKIFLAFLYQ